MRNLLLPLLLLTALRASAQPTLTSANRPQPGDECAYRDSQQPFPFVLQPGAAQIWDLSGMSFSYDHTKVYATANSAPGFSLFPAADVVMSPDGDYFEFYNYSAGQWRIIGGYFDGSGSSIDVIDPLLWMSYPCTYGTQWSDPYSYMFDGVPPVFEDTLVMNAAAYGTLILPDGTPVHDLLGLYREEYFYDVDTMTGDVYIDEVRRMDLWSPFSRCQVAGMLHILSVWSGSVNESWSIDLLDAPGLGLPENAGTAPAEVWPVPAQGTLNVRWEGGRTATAQVLDATGRRVLATTLQGLDAGAAIDVRTLGAGSYVLHLVAPDGARSVRSFTVER